MDDGLCCCCCCCAHEEIPLLSFHSMGTSLYDDRGDLFIHPSSSAPRSFPPHSFWSFFSFPFCRKEIRLVCCTGSTATNSSSDGQHRSSGCWGPGTLPAWRARLWALRLSNPPRRLPACHSQRGGIRGGLDGSWMVDDGFAVRTSLALASSVHCTAGPQQTGLSRPPFPRTPGRRHFAIACSSCGPPPVFFSSFPEELTELWILRV